ncbi:aspartate aminotransferase family protein [Hansschlegelia beijingensis]|uniref:4-aminobutyrate--pyruvate transaminase n=1 Tax=Hansschlegelia beijingensis TaxID=1133344 RepID=A0A7W6CVI4_9HYPH|nr:aspartate aminotransferase family protein [Hansschlegelia beijingensis]MBB3971871.1 4-aminobutyrate--pyruvate transaminase [Hansschlegelia beijingensis]
MLSNLQARDAATVLHPYTNLAALPQQGSLILERGDGVFVYDVEGKPYIEGMAGLWCNALGHGREELVEAASEQMRRLPFAHLFTGKSHDPAIALAEKLKELAPGNAAKAFFCNSGSEANDTQVKLVWYVNNALGRPQKKKIISRIKAYHGVTVASASLTGLPNNHIDFDLPLPQVRHAGCPHHYRFALEGETEEEFASRLAAELDAMIQAEGPDTVAAFIAEPVMGAGGVIVPPRTYFEKIQPVLEKYDVMLIADEVICGFGRLGEWFGSTALGMKPDTMSVAKQLSSSYLPIAAVIIPNWIDEALNRQSEKIGVFGHGFTYSGHPVAAAVALKTLEIYERENILGHVREVMPHFQQRLRAFGDHPMVGEARGMGLVGAVDLVADKASKRPFDAKRFAAAKVVALAQEEGLIVRAIGDAVSICPPLVITEEEIDQLFDRLGRALDRAESWAASEGARQAA